MDCFSFGTVGLLHCFTALLLQFREQLGPPSFSPILQHSTPPSTLLFLNRQL
ncbi:uncharacterized protein ASCRUDRAFT_76845, partial [Ascoidea rubescens DSM 1968]